MTRLASLRSCMVDLESDGSSTHNNKTPSLTAGPDVLEWLRQTQEAKKSVVRDHISSNNSWLRCRSLTNREG